MLKKDHIIQQNMALLAIIKTKIKHYYMSEFEQLKEKVEELERKVSQHEDILTILSNNFEDHTSKNAQYFNHPLNQA